MNKNYLVALVLLFVLPAVRASSVTRHFSTTSPLANSPVTVTLNVDITGSETFYVVDEVFPSGWIISDITGGGDTLIPSHIRWFVSSGIISTTYTYVATAPSFGGEYIFSGTYMFLGGSTESILGDTTVTVCAPTTEVCDGLDNDCDGEADEDFTNLGDSCSVGVGECENSGVYVCTEDTLGTECSVTAGTPTDEACDTLDNDCDGETDEDLITGCSNDCSQGVITCIAGVLSECSATPVIVGYGNACSEGTGACEVSGTINCEGECTAIAGTPSEEVCDGINNDCDSETDENPETLCAATVCPTTTGCDLGSCQNFEYGFYPLSAPNQCVMGVCEDNSCTPICSYDETCVTPSHGPKPILYGQVYDGTTPADDAIVTVFPKFDPEDFLTDIVGLAGSSHISSYWKINLFNLQHSVTTSEIIEIHAEKDGKTSQTSYTVNLGEGTHYFMLNLDPAYQDFDNDGFHGDVDCDDNDPLTYPGAPDPFGDGIDQNCNGMDGSGYEGSVQIYPGWTLFALVYKPIGIGTSEELGQAMMTQGDITCDVVMKYDAALQLMMDDILGFADPTFPLLGAEGYFIHCNNPATFAYEGSLWN